MGRGRWWVRNTSWIALGRRRCARGLTLFEFVVSLTVVMVFAGVLLERLRFYQEAAEKAAMEYTVSTLKTALQIRGYAW